MAYFLLLKLYCQILLCMNDTCMHGGADPHAYLYTHVFVSVTAQDTMSSIPLKSAPPQAHPACMAGCMHSAVRPVPVMPCPTTVGLLAAGASVQLVWTQHIGFYCFSMHAIEVSEEKPCTE